MAYLCNMKYSQVIGAILCLVIIGLCFTNWTYHPDLDKYFTGYFSEENVYGKPAILINFFSGLAFICFLIPRIWAKRLNMAICSILLAFIIKTFILFGGCYKGICPERELGLWALLLVSAAMLITTFLPDMKLKTNK